MHRRRHRRHSDGGGGCCCGMSSRMDEPRVAKSCRTSSVKRGCLRRSCFRETCTSTISRTLATVRGVEQVWRQSCSSPFHLWIKVHLPPGPSNTRRFEVLEVVVHSLDTEDQPGRPLLVGHEERDGGKTCDERQGATEQPVTPSV